MGLLDAWVNSDIVGYSYVGEKGNKAASNVVDYDVHSEITKDTSSVINANNETTTGMANVIPGINAPKLIASTSIYGDIGGGAAEFAETSLSFNGTILEGEYENFNVFNLTGDDFVSVDPVLPSHLLLEPGNYLLYAHIDVRDDNLVFYSHARYYLADGTIGARVYEINNAKATLTQMAIFSATEQGGHLRIGIRPENGDADTFTYSVLRLMKLG